MKPMTIFFVGLGLVFALIVGLVIRDRVNEARAKRAVQEFRQEQEEAVKEIEQQYQHTMHELLKNIED